MDSPDGFLRSRHSQASGRRLIFRISQDMSVAVVEAGDDRVFGEVDDRNSGWGGVGDLQNAVFGDHHIDVGRYLAGPDVDEMSGEDC